MDTDMLDNFDFSGHKVAVDLGGKLQFGDNWLIQRAF